VGGCEIIRAGPKGTSDGVQQRSNLEEGVERRGQRLTAEAWGDLHQYSGTERGVGVKKGVTTRKESDGNEEREAGGG